MIALFALAAAQETPPVEPAVEPVVEPAVEPEVEALVEPAVVERPSEEVVVYGQLAVDKARDAVVRDLEAMGYRAKRFEEDRVILRSGDWRGAVILHDDGQVEFTRPLLGMTEPPPELFEVDPARTGAVDPMRPGMNAGGPTFWVRPSDQRRAEAQAKVVGATEGRRAELRDVFTRTIEEDLLFALPDRLDAMSRDEVLAYWAQQADDPFGQRVTRAVERWMEANWTAAPVTPEERARHESGRQDGRSLPGAAE
jgi:hypothetical protein